METIEVKNSSAIHPSDLRSLRSFGQDYPEAERCLLYRGTERLKRDNILIEPCAVFLHRLK
jgi:hypothetical protein